MANLFSPEKLNKLFKWNEGVRTGTLRLQYNEMLQQVIEKDAAFLSNLDGETPYKTHKKKDGKLDETGLPEATPNYYNGHYCLTLNQCTKRCEDVISAATETGKRQPKNMETITETVPEKTDAVGRQMPSATPPVCFCPDTLNANMKRLPLFHYKRLTSNSNKDNKIDILKPNGTTSSLDALDATLILNNQLPLGSVIWLYYYERMGIFKILGALMDDYNYRGKMPISSKSENITSDTTLQYSELMDTICTLYRMGIGSNLRDRITLYQRVLGVSIENNLNIDSEKNENFMRHFNKLISLSIDYYQNKQLVQAIRDTNTNNLRSSVATQTAIRDTILVLQKNMEAFEYGRNRLNTYLGISMVYATICLLRMVKDEIGVPRQYNDPDEFIPAAYDILVLKRAVTSAETNRFTIYDNCASYGFRLLADIELIDTSQLTTIAVGSPLDAWLNDTEGLFEGYNNAFKSILEPASAIV